MGRIKTPCRLPSLVQALPHGAVLPADQTQTLGLLNALRRLARRLRGPQSQPFYTTREIAAFFGVPKTTVVRVYGALQQEGWLVRVRSSVTLLAAVRPQPRHPVRGVVGLPIWRPGYVQLPDWQLFFTEMEEKLRHHGFVADLIFYRSGEETQELGDRLQAHDLDALLWFYPHPMCLPLMQTLADAGVRLLAVTSPDPQMPCPCYVRSFDHGLAQGLAAWRKQGLTGVTFLHAGLGAQEGARWQDLARRVGLTLTLMSAPDWPAFTQRRSFTPTNGLVCVDDQWLGKFPQAEVLRALHGVPVMFLHRPMLATVPLAGLHADVVCLDWARVASRIAGDLATGSATAPGVVATFEAQWHPDAELSHFSAVL